MSTRALTKMVLSAELAPDGESLPTEFRLFAAGVNATTKGDFLFDDTAAAAVMAAYEAQGVEIMMDLNHESLDGDTMRQRRDAGDAVAWFKLQLRNGELWAVDVRWTPEGAERLRAKKQRYTSPAFFTDESGRITELINCALVAMPATHGNAPLVAATRTPVLGVARAAAVLMVALLVAGTYSQKARVHKPTPGVQSNGSRARKKDSRRNRGE